MLKENESTFSHFQKFLDSLMVLVCWALAFYLRFHLFPGGQPDLEMTYLKMSLAIILSNFYFFHRHGLYRSLRFSSRMSEIGAVLKSNAFAFVAAIMTFYFLAPERISRITLFIYLIISSIGLVAQRILLRNWLRRLRRNGKNLRHVLLVGNGPQMLRYVESIRKFKDAGIKIIGWCDDQGMAARLSIKPLEEAVHQLKEQFHPDFLVVGYPASEQKKAQDIITKEYNDVINIQIVPDLANIYIGHDISDFAGLPIITINSPGLSWMDTFFKRSLDIIGAGIGLVVLSPLLLVLSLLIKLTSPGPVLFGQKRVTLHGHPFTMWKFRSMRTDAEVQSGAVWAVKDDPRRTPIGKFLRQSSLDELPQLWNILVGDMSLVGPRPERPVFVDKFRHEVPAYMLRHKMRAGLTGWAQVNGWRGDTSLEKRIECDIYYIKHWSFWLDIKIILMTVWSGFVNKNAY